MRITHRRGLPGLRLQLGHPGVLALALGSAHPRRGPARPISARAADQVAPQESEADPVVHVEPKNVAFANRAETLLLGAVGVESEQAAQAEPAVTRAAVDNQVEAAKRGQDHRARVEPLHRQDFLMYEIRVDPPLMWPGAVEGFVLHLPGVQGRVVAIPIHGGLDESLGGGAEGPVLGDIGSVLGWVRERPFRHVVLGPSDSLHSHREDDRLARASRLPHQPVELSVSRTIYLIPVRGQADDPEVHRDKLLERGLVVEAQASRLLGSEAGTDLHRAPRRGALRRRRVEPLPGQS